MSAPPLPSVPLAAFTFGEILWISLLVTAVVLALRFWRGTPETRPGRSGAGPALPRRSGHSTGPSAEANGVGWSAAGGPPRPAVVSQSELAAAVPTTPGRPAGVLLWVALGFGSGRLRPGPGTWGSMVGVVWALVLLTPGWPWAYALGTVLAIGVAVPVCAAAARQLGDPDPGPVVLDEIVALPLALAGYAGLWWWQAGELPAPAQLRQWWPALVAAFVLFRLFDIWKPWPIRALQRLPGGWGVVLDDVAAGVVAAACLWGGTWAVFWYRLARG